jgi:hypothetical protein
VCHAHACRVGADFCSCVSVAVAVTVANPLHPSISHEVELLDLCYSEVRYAVGRDQVGWGGWEYFCVRACSVRLCACVRACVCVRICASVYASVWVYVCLCLCVCVCAHVFACMW